MTNNSKQIRSYTLQHQVWKQEQVGKKKRPVNNYIARAPKQLVATAQMLFAQELLQLVNIISSEPGSTDDEIMYDASLISKYPTCKHAVHKLTKSGQYSYSTAEQAYHQFINQNQGMICPPAIRMPLFFYMNCALHVKLCLTRLCFDITQSVFAASELRPLLIEIVRKLKLSYFSSWFKKEYENDTDKTTLLQLVGRDCDVLLSVMPAIITGLMNTYSTLRNNINFQKLFTLWKTYKTMAKPHLTNYYVTEEEIAQSQTKAYAFFEAVSGWSNERITWYVHWVKEHLSEYQNFLVEQGFRFDETSWFGVGAFSNQGSEHMNKVLKRRLLRNAMKN